jgi:multidrug efflux pump
VGVFFVCQMLTIYTTPVVYLYLDRLRLRWAQMRKKEPETAGLQPLSVEGSAGE